VEGVVVAIEGGIVAVAAAVDFFFLLAQAIWGSIAALSTV
jgi:hypothetical protein